MRFAHWTTKDLPFRIVGWNDNRQLVISGCNIVDVLENVEFDDGDGVFDNEISRALI
jgi:hypothetical protein